jgi:hypothetical protein
MTEPLRMHELLGRYGDPMPLLDQIPRTAGEVYRNWADVPEAKALSRRERNERRWLARHLQLAASRGEIERQVVLTEDRQEYVAFNAKTR